MMRCGKHQKENKMVRSKSVHQESDERRKKIVESAVKKSSSTISSAAKQAQATRAKASARYDKAVAKATTPQQKKAAADEHREAIRTSDKKLKTIQSSARETKKNTISRANSGVADLSRKTDIVIERGIKGVKTMLKTASKKRKTK